MNAYTTNEQSDPLQDHASQSAGWWDSSRSPDQPDSHIGLDVLRARYLRRQRMMMQRQSDRIGTEAKLFLRFAEMWAPYGGPPAADIFETFGMTPGRFHEKLRESIDRYNASIQSY